MHQEQEFIKWIIIFIIHHKEIHNLQRIYTEQKKKGILNLVLNYAFFI